MLMPFISQALSSDLESVTQGLLTNVSMLEERIASAENESKAWQEKASLLIDEKTAIKNEMALLKESLQTSEKEKQVGFS